MNKRRLWTLIAGPGLAALGLLLVLLLLGRSTAGATSDGDAAIPEMRSPGGTFTVSGTVTCQATGPISDVDVYAWNRDKGSGVVGDITDNSGAYRVTLEEGNYDLIFNPHCGSGCASKAYKGISGPPGVTLNVVLSPGYTVSGTVFAADGTTPVSGVSIYAFRHETADGFGLPLTEADGHYCIGLITGTYDLGFTPPPCRGLGPRTVVTTVNQDMTHNVILPPGFTVAGCVTDGSGSPVPGVQVYANDPMIGGFGFAPTNETGCYTGTLPYSGSPPTGVYDVQFIPSAGLGLGSVTITDVVSTTSGCPNATLPITLPAGFTLSGRVTCNGKGIKGVFVYALSQGPQDLNNSLPGYGIFTVDDGSYGLPLVSGTYRLEFTPPLATGLNAKAFTTTQIITDTNVNVDFCICSGAWVTETVDGVGNVGNGGDTSLALAPTYPYTPHIGYSSVSSQGVKHAWLSGTIWLSDTVYSSDTVDPQESNKGPISLALVPTYPYTPCIAYHDTACHDIGCSGVWFAHWDGTTWVNQMVEAGHFEGNGGVSLALEPVYPYTPHVSYNLPYSVYDLKYAYLSSTTWMSGTWMSTTVESSGTVGSDSSLALEQTYPYTPHISYSADYTNGDVKHAWPSGTTWLSETVDSEGSVGRWSTSLALDGDGDPHVSYLDSTNLFSFDLKYAWRSGTTWLTETVDSEGDVGWFTSLALDGRGNPHISYYGRAPGGLKYARFDGRVWIVQTVDSGIDVGRHSSLALDPGGCPHISYYNAPRGDLKYAYILPLADVTIAKSGYPSALRAGVRLTYTLVYSNAGMAIATGVLITDAVPGTLTDVSYTYAGAALTPTGSIRYAWEVEDLSPGEGGAITVTGTVSPSVSGVFSLTNRATIATDCPDDNPDNNASVVHTLVDAEPPEIAATAPVSGAADVHLAAPVVITFSESIEAGTFAYTVAPDPGGWSETWSAGGAAVTLAHHSFAYSTTYAVTVTAADDLVGNPLFSAPYAWHFATTPYRVYLPIVMRN